MHMSKSMSTFQMTPISPSIITLNLLDTQRAFAQLTKGPLFKEGV